MNQSVKKTGEHILNSSVDHNVDEMPELNEQYLTFELGDEIFAINILSVKEISGWEKATLIPNSPDYVKGVINMRGTIVPIVDLRSRFAIGEISYLPTTVIIIMTSRSKTRHKTVGFVVDAVSDVIAHKTNEIRQTSEFKGSVAMEYIHGLINKDSNLITLLDVDKLIEIDG